MEHFVKEYLNKQEIKTVEGLAEHIIELKRNTVVPKIVFELVNVLVNDKDCLLSFFAENIEPQWQIFTEFSNSGHFQKLEDLEKNVINKTRQEKIKIVLDDTVGKKESQTVEKAPIFTYCKVNKNAIEALSLRALHGHIKYEKPNDWENFTRVPNADFEYSNSQFRHALDIGEEDEETHLIASAWNSVARLELYLRNKVK